MCAECSGGKLHLSDLRVWTEIQCQSVHSNLCNSHGSLGLAYVKSSRAGVESDRPVGIHLLWELSGVIELSLPARNLVSAELRF